MADGEDIPPHGIQISHIDVEPIITDLFGLWRPGVVLSAPAILDVKPWVVIPEDGDLLGVVRTIKAAAQEAHLGAHRARRSAKQGKS